MKRLALVATYLLIFCAATTLAGAQNWQPGMPGPGFAGPPGVGMPGLGGPPGPGIPGLGAPLGGPNCGTSMCQPMPPCLKPPILFGSYAAWQVNSDPGKIKFSTQGTSLLLNDSSTAVQFNVNGVWVGGPHAQAFSDCFSAPVEGRVFIPSKESATSVTARRGLLCQRLEFMYQVSVGTNRRGLGVRLRPMLVGPGWVTLGFIICFHGKSHHHSRILLCFRRIGFDYKCRTAISWL
jgi:hypothetical protein